MFSVRQFSSIFHNTTNINFMNRKLTIEAFYFHHGFGALKKSLFDIFHSNIKQKLYEIKNFFQDLKSVSNGPIFFSDIKRTHNSHFYFRNNLGGILIPDWSYTFDTYVQKLISTKLPSLANLLTSTLFDDILS